MRFFVDHSQPADSLNHHWTQTSYDGKPESDLLQIPKHWHKHHDEFMEVIEGRMTFYLEGKGEVILSAGDPVLKIPRWYVHAFQAFPGEPVTFKEYTNPPGDYKETFFRDFFQKPSPSFLMAMRAFYDGDTYVGLPGNLKIIDQVFMNLVGTIARAFAPAKLVLVQGGGGKKDALAAETSGVLSEP